MKYCVILSCTRVQHETARAAAAIVTTPDMLSVPLFVHTSNGNSSIINNINSNNTSSSNNNSNSNSIVYHGIR